MVGNFSAYITFHCLIVEKKQADRGFLGIRFLFMVVDEGVREGEVRCIYE